MRQKKFEYAGCDTRQCPLVPCGVRVAQQNLHVPSDFVRRLHDDRPHLRGIGARADNRTSRAGLDKGEAIRYAYPSWGEDAMCAHHGHNARVEVFADPHVESLRVVLKHLAREPLRAPRI